MHSPVLEAISVPAEPRIWAAPHKANNPARIRLMPFKMPHKPGGAAAGGC